MVLCEYGCEQEATHQFKNSKWCCNITSNKCPSIRKKNSEANQGKLHHFYGKKFSQKYRKKISNSKIGERNPNFGKSPSAETRKKMRISHFGKTRNFTSEHKRNMSKARRGKTFSKRPEHAKFMREHNPMFYVDMTGENNPNWKGGISKNGYCSGWVHLSKEIRDYYGGCQNPNCCGKSKRLTTHHIDYDKENCYPDNLIPLCNICNGKANGNREYHYNFYKGIKENDQMHHT